MCHISNSLAGAAAFVGMEATHNSINPKENTFIQNALHFLFSKHFLAPRVSLPLAESSPSAVKAKAGASFPWVISESRRLLGDGLRKKMYDIDDETYTSLAVNVNRKQFSRMKDLVSSSFDGKVFMRMLVK
ncbi:hypothetical protein SADUNF_Sadunf05G0154700 [Salix dunnii]|uniref:Uncharacterized protein n=1 Tax=Salix dunnii TaxID=1413687 RepID=A0A835K8X3_9ROSI|nr:hypothetical protein SADUNF_Sadunf05G0154700 [Salix dunnii]